MKNAIRLLPLLLLPLFALPSCDADTAVDDPFAGEIPPEDVFGLEWRGWGFGQSTIKLNTNIVNGASISTVRFGYPTAYGSEVSWIYSVVHGEFLDMATVEVKDGAIQGFTDDGEFVNAHSFEGSIWAIETGATTSIAVIEDVRYASEVGLANAGAKLMTNLDPNRLVYKWTSPSAPAAGTKVDPKTGWGGSYDGLHTCPVDAKGSTWSVLYGALLVNEANGAVDSASWAPEEYAYIGCLGGRIGKTALWGYAPDNPSPAIPDLSLAEFEGAHRMVGAEYCGDGKSYTRAGEAVTLVDKWSINQHGSDGVSDEAVWSTTGALCVGTPRWEVLQAGPILCASGVTIPSCSNLAGLYYGWSSSAKWWTRNPSFAD